MSEKRESNHHGLPLHEVLLIWGTDPKTGLSSSEADERLTRYGTNTLPPAKDHGPFIAFVKQFNSPLIYVLLGASIITAAIGEWVDFGVILAVVIVNAIVGFIQEQRAGHALAALAEMTRTQAHVLRDGDRKVIDSELVVPGDVVILGAGDKVPADLRLMQTHELRVDESALTGESLPVDKNDGQVDSETGLADRLNMAYSSTLVTAGSANGIVVETGATTEIGRIHQLVGAAAGVQTPLTRKLARFSIWLTAAILLLTAVSVALGLIRGLPLAQVVTSAVAIAVAAIPEGLPAVVTITLAIGVSRMARRNAIIRKLPAVETLGSTTVICTDKTGTLTENQMTVQFIATSDDVHDVREDVPESVNEVLRAGLLCNDATATIGDPTEVALVLVAERGGMDQEAMRGEHPRVDEIPFDSDLRYMATAHSSADGTLVFVKGAAEEILALCDDVDADAVLQQVADYGGMALRVLAFAMTTAPEGWTFDDGELTDLPLTYLGLQAMADPPRPEAIRAIQACHRAGIDVKMITGDHMRTAQAIALEIGLTRDPSVEPKVLTGKDISQLDRAQLAEELQDVTVVARVSAEQKLQIVEALQARHHVVAMTGDGINDAPALKQADIGVAMGQGGTEVAKEAAAMVLTDDNFASIESAVEEGRGVFANLTKFITFALPTNLGQGLIIMTAIIAGLTLPILPVQILWVNMTTAVALGLTLAFEPTEDTVMDQPPRPPGQAIITRSILFRMFFVGLLMLAGAYFMFETALADGSSLEVARTAAVNAVIAIQIGYLFNCRSLNNSVFRIGFFSNPSLLWGIAIMIALTLAFTYVPIMQTIFQSAPLDVGQWGIIVLMALAVSLIIGVEKAITNRLRDRTRPAQGSVPSLPNAAEATTRR
jgi:cation-transporting P-type ATPase F